MKLPMTNRKAVDPFKCIKYQQASSKITYYVMFYVFVQVCSTCSKSSVFYVMNIISVSFMIIIALPSIDDVLPIQSNISSLTVFYLSSQQCTGIEIFHHSTKEQSFFWGLLTFLYTEMSYSQNISENSEENNGL